MNGTYSTHVGDRGRVVLPIELRQRAGLHPGTSITLVETDHGIVVLTLDQLRDWVRRDLHDLDLVSELLEERRRAAAADAA